MPGAPNMSRLSSSVLVPLAKALSRAYRSPTELAALLLPLDKRFDDLTSQKESLLTNATEIVLAAQDQGWSGELLQALLKDRPNNADVRALAEVNPEFIEGEARSRRRNPGDRPSLTCGRADQWNSVTQCAQAQSHQVIVVPGCLGQATLHFRDRVQAQLSPPPSRSMVIVSWVPPPPPKTLPELLERLADALAPIDNTLEQTIAARLAYKNLFVLHPCLSAGFRGEHFREYYTKWWPSVVEKLETPYHVKCVQPIEWPVTPTAAQSWWQRLVPDDQPKGETEARGLIETLTKQKMSVRILAVDELQNLQPRELEKFFATSSFTDDERVYLAEQLAGGPQVPRLMFDEIDRYWREVAGNQ